MSLPTLEDYPMAWGVNSVRWVIMYPRIQPQEEPLQNVFYVPKVGTRRYKRKGTSIDKAYQLRYF